MTFSWNDSGASNYKLWVGSSEGANDICRSSASTNTSQTVYLLPYNGETVYVRLWSEINQEWHFNDYTFTAMTLTSDCPNGASQCDESLVCKEGSVKLPMYEDRTKYACYKEAIEIKHTVQTYDGDLGYYDGANQKCAQEFGDEWRFCSMDYYLPNGAYMINGLQIVHSPFTDLSFATNTVTQSSWIAHTQGHIDCRHYRTNDPAETGLTITDGSEPAYNCYTQPRYCSVNDNVTETVSCDTQRPLACCLDINKENIMELYLNDPDAYILSGGIPKIQSPVCGSTLSSITETFTWDDTEADKYWLSIGTSSGTDDIYSGDEGTNTSKTVTGLPSGGEILYVRLSSMIDGDWYTNDCTYTAFNDTCLPITLQNGTATFSQDDGTYAYTVDMAVDGFGDDSNESNNYYNGWGIYDFDTQETKKQTAVWETSTDLAAGQLKFKMYFKYPYVTTIGRFRLSVTTDDRSEFADGENSGGDIDANWIVLTNPSVLLPSGMTSQVIVDDESIL
ncbi:MAG: hypothetical protein GY751_10200, partial [Bacteroidetes bacterium]|nr:hypothetical protein [Bacteroidota bacterium]